MVQLHGVEEPVEFKRNLASPNQLICDDSVLEIIKPVLELASRGQHVLTRREILNYVNADSIHAVSGYKLFLRSKMLKKHVVNW